jgi:hypothetical protein
VNSPLPYSIFRVNILGSHGDIDRHGGMRATRELDASITNGHMINFEPDLTNLQSMLIALNEFRYQTSCLLERFLRVISRGYPPPSSDKTRRGPRFGSNISAPFHWAVLKLKLLENVLSSQGKPFREAPDTSASSTTGNGFSRV